MPRQVTKGFQLVTLDECYRDVVKADGGAGSPRQVSTPASPPPSTSDVASRPKKFPRRLKPTVRMKPISDAEAMAHIASGTYNPNKQKSLRWLVALKALATGYSKTSGGGALKAANRRSRDRPSRRSWRTAPYLGPDGRYGKMSGKDRRRSLRRAMEAMSSPIGSAKPPSVYLPGVHNPKSPVRSASGIKKPKKLAVAKPGSSGNSMGKAGETAAVGRGSRGGAVGAITGAAVGRTLNDARHGNSPGRDVTRFGITTVASKPSNISASERERISAKRAARMAKQTAEKSSNLESSMAKAEHSFGRGDLVVHNASADPKAHGTIGAVGPRSTGTHIHLRTAGSPPRMVHHSEVRAATADDIKHHQSTVHKLHGLGFTDQATAKGISMSTTNFNDLFKSELGTPEDEVLTDCPHCEAPITKGDLEKAHKGKGKTTHQTGPKHGKSSAHVRDHNPEGGTMRGGDGRGVHTSSRGVPGAKKTDEVRMVGQGRRVLKADDVSGEDDLDDRTSKAEVPPTKDVNKSVITIRGTEYVQYVDDGSDGRIAKAIAEGAIGGTSPTQPLDLNNDLSRLLI